MRAFTFVLGIGLVFTFASTAQAISTGQIDDFQAGTAGWTEGAASPNQPFQNINGGPGGVGDHSLRNISSGVAGPGGSMVMFNNAQWTGDYLAAGVNSISGLMRVDPASASPLLMRIAIEGNPGEQYASLNAINVPNDGAWYAVSFSLAAPDLFHFAGTDPLGVVLSNVTELRILHSTAPSWYGGVMQATLDVDNVTAVPEPATLSIAVLGALVLVRRR